MPTNSAYGFGLGGFGQGQFGNAPVESLPIGYYVSLLTSLHQELIDTGLTETVEVDPAGSLYGEGTYGDGQYSISPIYTTTPILGPKKIAQWLTAALQPLDDASQCLESFLTAFDLDSAVGAQLDILGQIIGQSRTVGFQPSNSVSPVLDDATYRLLLHARIAQNQWNGTIDSLQTLWAQLFPGGHIAIDDGQNMTATIILSGSFASITQDLITNGYIVPRPEAVLYNYIFPELPAFGFDLNNAYIAGFDIGKWS